jgi:hypothetical protein
MICLLIWCVAEAAISRRSELTEGELLGLLQSFAAMGRWFFDSRLLDGLAAGVRHLYGEQQSSDSI